MKIILQMFIVLTIIFPIINLVGACWMPEKYYNLQKKILTWLMSKSSRNEGKLLLTGGLILFCVWSILCTIISLLETLI
ncbi:hypothetical protein IE044AEMC_01494 [Enterococcus faecalis]|uniref:hypothetical protein n=1 Tax=Enterococcus faecalis TaxID=1351 RepID=UPI00115EE84C|nr:hypothetical protein [Enterococcus faecalis]CAC9764382.1 hypothetical protein IE313HC_01263 [Enterococcus faecalis]CAC9764682.1 hypothetical protein IE044AEGC_01328 [Enterococcus faecalis]CAC9770106.1 hypothetical protein IE183ART_02490 [Enterococcus faecalis]CAC9778523.1 hypothetical protein IE044AEMC_01494 [Enterococcus faecalis]CAC9780173.1 hypothetical protein IE044CO2MC_01286 [Enterococcus faecalis]